MTARRERQTTGGRSLRPRLIPVLEPRHDEHEHRTLLRSQRHMPSARRPLFTIHESGSITAELWNRFADVAKQRAGTITAALADCMRRYIDEHQPGQGQQRDDTTTGR